MLTEVHVCKRFVQSTAQWVRRELLTRWLPVQHSNLQIYRATLQQKPRLVKILNRYQLNPNHREQLSCFVESSSKIVTATIHGQVTTDGLYGKIQKNRTKVACLLYTRLTMFSLWLFSWEMLASVEVMESCRASLREAIDDFSSWDRSLMLEAIPLNRSLSTTQRHENGLLPILW